MSILDQILDGAKIVSENHDPRSIDYIAGEKDPAEMLKLGRNVSERQDAALQRASLDTTGGKVRFVAAGVPGWHKLGTLVDKAMTSEEAMSFSYTNFQVEKIPVSYQWSGMWKKSEETFALVRADNGVQLGTVGARYEVIQNKDSFGFLDAVIGKFGAKYEVAGSLYGGKKLFLVVHMPKLDFAINGNDEQKSYVMFTNQHGGEAGHCFPTSHRAVCANTTRISQKEDSHKGISIRHTGSIRNKIEAAQQALGLAVHQFEEFRGVAEAMTTKPMDIRHYANDVLDAVLDVTAAQAKMGANVLAAAIAKTTANLELERKSFERKIERRGEILNDILKRYDSPENGIGGMRGTAWGCYNAVSASVDHSDKWEKRRGSEQERASRRFESIINGRADSVKQEAFQKAIAQ